MADYFVVRGQAVRRAAGLPGKTSTSMSEAVPGTLYCWRISLENCQSV